MKTRDQYLNSEYTYDEYYSQFVNESVRIRVHARIGKGMIINSKDKHFNDIPLHRWDSLQLHTLPSVVALLNQAGDPPCLAHNAWIGKAYAKTIRGW